MNSTNSTTTSTIIPNPTTTQTLQASVRNAYQFFYYSIAPAITVIAVLINIMCTIVFGRKEMRSNGRFFIYLFVIAIISTFTIALTGLLSLTRCGSYCSTISSTFFAQIVELFDIYIIIQISYTVSAFLQTVISFEIYYSMKNKKTFISSPKFVIPVSVILCFIGLLTLLGLKTSVSSSGSYNISVVGIFSIVPIGISAVLNIIFLITLIIVNCLIFYQLRVILRKKVSLLNIGNGRVYPMLSNNLTVQTTISWTDANLDNYTQRVENDSKESEKRTLIMLLFISFFFVSARLVFVFEIIALVAGSSYQWQLIDMFYFCFNSLIYSSYLGVYYKTNKIFRRVFLKTFFRRKLN